MVDKSEKLVLPVTPRLEDACLLSQTADAEDTVAVCNLAAKYNIGAVVCSLSDVPPCKELLQNTHVKVVAVVSFPYGFDNTKTKVAAVANAIYEGADAVDFVINLGSLMDSNFQYLREEFFEIGQLPIDTRAIIELSLLNPTNLKMVCEILETSHVSYVKTCTGKVSDEVKLTLGEKIKKIGLIKKWAPNKKIKLSGGVKSLADARKVLDAGVHLIGTSATFKIAQEELEETALKKGA